MFNSFGDLINLFGKKKGDKQAADGAYTPLPGYLGGTTPMTYPQAMPGQLEAIAAQLSQGFGQPAKAYMKQMDALYSPSSVPYNYQPQAAAPAAAAPVPSNSLTAKQRSQPHIYGIGGYKGGSQR